LAKEKVVLTKQQIDFSKYFYSIYILEFVKSSGETVRVKVLKK